MQVSDFDPEGLRETIDLEAKRAGGRDGKGALPRNLFETYSAFANTDGGVIMLGVDERQDGRLHLVGIERADQVSDDLWNQLNNPQKVSDNLLHDAAVRKHPVNGSRWVVEIVVPRASRKQRPVFINHNPINGIFKRLHTGDWRLPLPGRRNQPYVRRADARRTRRARAGTLRC